MNFFVPLLFYKNIWRLTITISLITCFLFWQSGERTTIISFFWTKLITNALAILYFHLFDAGKRYFYFNLGYTLRRLYTLAMVFDFLLWIVLIFITCLFI